MVRSLGSLAAAAAILLQINSSNAAEPRVVVTIKPIHSLASAVMQGVAEPQLLIDGARSPHTFALKPSDARALNGADVVVRVSEGLEPFMTKVVSSLPARVTVMTLVTVPGLTLHEQRSGGTFAEHRHAHGSHGNGRGPAGGGHEHGTQEHDDDDAHQHAGGRDAHIWLDPSNAKIIATSIAEALSARFPQNAQRFRSNAAALAVKLDELSAELASALRPLAGRRYLVFHDAYQYLERRYGLEPVGSVTVSPDLAPSGKRLIALRRKIVNLRVACVFAEPQFEPKLVATVIEGTHARAATLDPLGAAIPSGPDLYFTLMRTLASDLAKCLAPS